MQFIRSIREFFGDIKVIAILLKGLIENLAKQSDVFLMLRENSAHLKSLVIKMDESNAATEALIKHMTQFFITEQRLSLDKAAKDMEREELRTPTSFDERY